MRVGITSTIPLEVLVAAGAPAIDLNNVFVAHPERQEMVERAERAGFPDAGCSWIKGIYSAVRAAEVDCVIAITQGDCSNTHALMEILETEGVRTIPFAYPYDRDPKMLRARIEKLASAFGVGMEEVGRAKRRLDGLRRKVGEIDRLTWQEGKVSGLENHLYQISCSDMTGDLEAFEKKVDEFLQAAAARKSARDVTRLGYIGIPPIVDGLYEYAEALGGSVVYNEIQRQFSMPFETDDIVEQYLRYTYPYHVRYSLEDIETEVSRRRISGVIHYVQAFCFRQAEDIIIRKRLNVPVLTLEGNRPGRLDLRTRLRLEAFLTIF
jgi:benzoyl-CoA reductase/2-hydroxyglutaryl-CoA dehydratase subunit BcrC/BadD/HgdB